MVFDYQGEKSKDYQLQEHFKKSRIILLDEATSSLDADTEERLGAINYLTKETTILKLIDFRLYLIQIKFML